MMLLFPIIVGGLVWFAFAQLAEMAREREFREVMKRKLNRKNDELFDDRA